MIDVPRYAVAEALRNGTRVTIRAVRPDDRDRMVAAFEKLGLPDHGPQGVPHTAYTIQEGLYRGFAAPVALYVALGAVLCRDRHQVGGGAVGVET